MDKWLQGTTFNSIKRTLRSQDGSLSDYCLRLLFTSSAIKYYGAVDDSFIARLRSLMLNEATQLKLVLRSHNMKETPAAS
jgi:hypothetical protein